MDQEKTRNKNNQENTGPFPIETEYDKERDANELVVFESAQATPLFIVFTDPEIKQTFDIKKVDFVSCWILLLLFLIKRSVLFVYLFVLKLFQKKKKKKERKTKTKTKTNQEYNEIDILVCKPCHNIHLDSF